MWGLVGIVSSIIALIAIGIVTLANAGSRNLTLAAAALLATFIVYAVQARFELQPTTATRVINLEYTIDQDKPGIRQWEYPPSTGPIPARRIISETRASDWLAGRNAEVFRMSRPDLTYGRTLVSDLAIFSLVSFLATNEFDWQLQFKAYRGRASGQFYTAHRVSTPRECSIFREADLHARLTTAHNLFYDAAITMIGGELCLPPQTILNITGQSVTLRNRMCEIVFELDVPDSIVYGRPGSGGLDGLERYATRVLGFNVSTKFFALRAQHPDSIRYKAWASRVVENARLWFEE